MRLLSSRTTGATVSLFYEDLTYKDLVDWAGEEHVERATLETVTDWQIPTEDKAVLVEVGVPHVEHLVTRACFQTEAQPTLQTNRGTLLYRLTEEVKAGLRWFFGAEPGTGVVHHVAPDGGTRFANSSVVLWVQSLHHYGLRIDTSDLLLNADWHEEDNVLAELKQLSEELKEFDPAAFDGDHDFLWEEFLARWLW